MKQKRTTGEDVDKNKTVIWDVPVEIIKSLKEFAIHVIKSETLTLEGKANLIVIFGFLIAMIIYIFKDVNTPLMCYIFIAIGIMSCIISSTALERIRAKQLENRLKN